MSSPRYVFHLIANSHLDPVWLWDWREGLNEGIITIRTILKLMEEFPELTYIRGETAIYEQVQRYDPASFERIKEYVVQGRWDYVGGTYVQPDTNLPGTETMVRHFTCGQRFFTTHFGKPARVAWAADSFGHSAGLPAIFTAAGIRYYAFNRPSASLFPLESPAFRWEGSSGASILTYRAAGGWYGTDRGGMAQRLDQCLAEAEKHPLRHVGVFYGMGNHGGGPSRRQLHDLREWTGQHPDIEVVHSGLHRFFAALDEETANCSDLPVIRGELNFFARGCYASAARFKFKYRRAEAGLWRAERTTSAIAAGLGAPVADLQDAWRGLLFNSFHDILPGSSIERATDEQISWVEGLIHSSQQTEFDSLNQLAGRIHLPLPPAAGDYPQPVAVLVWNSHPQPYRGPLELEASVDYRPLWAYENRVEEVPLQVCDSAGTKLPFQVIATENHFMPNLPWRKRVVLDAEVPALGWAVYTLGWVEGARPLSLTRLPATSPGQNEVAGGGYHLRAVKGTNGVQVEYKGRPVFKQAGLGLQSLDDPWGAWGNHYEEPEAEDISTVLATWEITDAQVLESGPLRARLWVRLAEGASRAELTFDVHHDGPAVEVQARIFWDRPAARLKLVLPGVGTEAEYEVCGGTIRRGALKEVPGGRWVRCRGENGGFGFASDAIYNFDLKDDNLRATIVRSSRYASDLPETAQSPRHLPVIDRGEYRFKFLFTAIPETLPVLARLLEAPLITLPIAPRDGTLPSRGSFARLESADLQLLSLKRAEDGRGWVVRLQETAGKDTSPVFTWLNQPVVMEPLPKSSIGTYLLTEEGDSWIAHKVGLTENTP